MLVFFLQVCQTSLATITSMEQHLLDGHLKLMLYKCELCSMKLRTEADYKEHILTEHGASSIQTMELPEGVEAAGQGVVILQEGEAGGETDTALEHSVTTIIINQEEQQRSMVYVPEADCLKMVEKKKGGRVKTEKIFVAGAEKAILGKTKAKLDKLTRGQLFSQAEADDLVKQNLNRTILDRLYHCLVCEEDWSSTKLDLAREHIYDHFGVYLYQVRIVFPSE